MEYFHSQHCKIKALRVVIHRKTKSAYKFVPPLGGGAAILLSPSPQVDQQPVLKRVDGFVSVETREAWLTLSLRLSVNRGESQEVVFITEPPDSPYV